MRFTAPDVLDPSGPVLAMHWFEHWADDELIAACAPGAPDDVILALAVAQAHYALATLLIHEVGEWFTYRGRQVFPPHRPDPYLPLDEDGGPDGNGAVVLWLTYGPAAAPGPAAGRPGAAPAPVPVSRPVSAPGPGAGESRPCCPVPPPVPRRAVRRRVDPADVATLPGQLLTLSPYGPAVTAPDSAALTSGTWSPPQDHHQDDEDVEAVERELRDIHHALVMSELTMLAAHLKLHHAPVLTPLSGPVRSRCRLARPPHL
ncbi:hypothetical protein [Streptomyces syringium]|uniref:hypothetical protein n=1 Tax=Streptomyces syringium TaxID=76729 RepID=UPI0033D0755D